MKAITTIEELTEALNLQRKYADRVTLELNGAVSEDAAKTVDLISQLLHSYAMQPTISELEGKPELLTMFHPGATFAVSLIVGEVLVRQIATLYPAFPDAHLFALVLFLSDQYIDEVFWYAHLVNSLKLTFAVPLSREEQEEKAHKLLVPLGQACMEVSALYGLFTGTKITRVGKLVAAHLRDGTAFLSEVMKAHSTLKNKPASTDQI